MIVFNDILLQLDFLYSPIGILSQIALFTATILPFFKYMNNKLDQRIDNHINNKIKPIVDSLCKQLQEESQSMKEFRNEINSAHNAFESKTNTSIKYIDRAVMRLEGMKEDKEIKDKEGGC
jgi:hypothetical protein